MFAMRYYESPWIQTISYFFCSFLATILILGAKPFEDPFTNGMEVFDEVIVLLTGYHIFIFAAYDLNPKIRMKLGWSLIAHIGILITANILRFLTGMLRAIRLRCIRRRRKIMMANKVANM